MPAIWRPTAVMPSTIKCTRSAGPYNALSSAKLSFSLAPGTQAATPAPL